ncbi:MAG TPA: hypothetical protein VEH31_40415, partial [Streptosporangiaceae bacterium]|nr:hypothetical protein [Streptosporangiaceae bacterium]
NRPHMYHTTGFTKAQITELCERIEARELAPGMRRWPPKLGLRNALTVALTYMRRGCVFLRGVSFPGVPVMRRG